MSSSIDYERAVPFYDQTREHPTWVQEAITRSIVQQVNSTGVGHILETGIGTGRIALPLLERGLDVVGVDLSLGMMGELRKKTTDKPYRAALAQADAVALPFADDAFDAVYAVNVLHLVAGWQAALREAYRVVRPGGALLVNYHQGSPKSARLVLHGKFSELVRAQGMNTQHPGAKSTDELFAEMTRLGEPHKIRVVEWDEPTSVAQILDALEAQIVSETWYIPAAMMKGVMPDLRRWAAGEFGDVARIVRQDMSFNWMTARKPVIGQSTVDGRQTRGQ